MDKNKKVLFVTSEATPFAKTGGLGDVAGSLPKALSAIGLDVRVIMPKYQTIAQDQLEDVAYKSSVYVDIKGASREGILLEKPGEVPVYFIENDYYFNRPGLYGYDDDQDRFAFFIRAVLNVLPETGFMPDIIHLNDWQTGPMAMLLKDDFYRKLYYYKNVKTLYTIHNLQYQGVFFQDALAALGVNPGYYHPDAVEFYGMVSYMKAGIQFSDAVSTVSETYAQEIQTGEYGYGLDGLLRAKKDRLYGILNGIDYDINNPETDFRIYKNFAKGDLEGKRENKYALQRELHLPEGDMPLLCLISRLAEQKGIHMLAQVAERLLQENIQLAVLGTGEWHFENMFYHLASRYPDKMSANLSFNEKLSVKMYAGSDFFLMPSLFEPCGLSQMFSFRYGTIPIARRTGGLKDTITHFDGENGNGFLFDAPTGDALYNTIQHAFGFYYDESARRKLVQNAMACDFSWTNSAIKYKELYDKMTAV